MAVVLIHSLRPIVDANGIPISGALVYVYDVGTTTLKTVYSDSTLSTTAANPVVCTGGFCPLRYLAAGTYKVSVTEADGTALTAYSGDNIDPGVPVGSGALPVASGGTGSTTAAAARTALGAASSASLATTAADVATLQDTLTGTDATQIAAGTTAQRPVSPATGQIRENSTTTKFEGYISGGWDNFMLESASASSTGAVAAETAETTYIRPDRLQNSYRVAKLAALITFSGGTPSLTAGLGFSSTVTDNGTGDITLNFSATQADTNYIISVTPQHSGTILYSVTTKSTTQLRITTFNTSFVATDPTTISVIVYRVT